MKASSQKVAGKLSQKDSMYFFKKQAAKALENLKSWRLSTIEGVNLTEKKQPVTLCIGDLQMVGRF